MTTGIPIRTSGTKKTIGAHVAQPIKKKVGQGGTKAATTLRFKEKDTPYGITKKTAKKAADGLGLSLDMFFHIAAVQLIQNHNRNYEPAYGDITPEGIARVQQLGGNLAPNSGQALFSFLPE